LPEVFKTVAKRDNFKDNSVTIYTDRIGIILAKTAEKIKKTLQKRYTGNVR